MNNPMLISAMASLAAMSNATHQPHELEVTRGRADNARQGRRLSTPQRWAEKYPGQSTAYLIGAHCEEGRRMREVAR